MSIVLGEDYLELKAFKNKRNFVCTKTNVLQSLILNIWQ